MMSKGGSDQA